MYPKFLNSSFTAERVEGKCNMQHYQFCSVISLLKGISNSSKMNNTSHVIQMFKDKRERL
jgi:hypothetical protein